MTTPTNDTLTLELLHARVRDIQEIFVERMLQMHQYQEALERRIEELERAAGTEP